MLKNRDKFINYELFEKTLNDNLYLNKNRSLQEFTKLSNFIIYAQYERLINIFIHQN